MDQATWRVVSKLNALKFFVGKNTFSTVEQLKVATVAINQVLTELKVREEKRREAVCMLISLAQNISPDNFLQ